MAVVSRSIAYDDPSFGVLDARASRTLGWPGYDGSGFSPGQGDCAVCRLFRSIEGRVGSGMQVALLPLTCV